MSTRSAIMVKRPDGKFEGIYCHWDGHVTGVGANLLAHYNSFELAAALVALGDISTLRPKPVPAPNKAHSFDHPQEGVTIAYHRDRQEPWEDISPKIEATAVEVASHIGHNRFVYLFADGKWTVNGLDLAEVAKREDADELAYQACAKAYPRSEG